MHPSTAPPAPRLRTLAPNRGLAVLLAVLPTVLLTPAPAPAAVAASGWSAPVPQPLAVVRPFDPPPRPWLPGHRGVDLAAAPGTEVRAAGAGMVAFAGHLAGRFVVSVAHADGLRTTYEPVIPVVRRGQRIAEGALIGRVDARGGHCRCLHWGLRRGRDYVDPLLLLAGRPILKPVGGGIPAAP